MKGQEIHNQSLKVVPGGVHSPVRSFKGMNRPPIYFSSGNGAYLKDMAGKSYLDFCMSFGPLILGHKNSLVEKKLIHALGNGWSFGACEPYSLDLAKQVLGKIEFADQIRFVNSGTEAVMTALRLARGYKNRSKIIKFDGCYHGHVDSMLIKAGSGLAGTATSSSAGVSEAVASETLILPLGDLDLLRKCFIDHPGEIAGVIIEPLPANNGLLEQTDLFLKGLSTLCREFDALLIFDEVISGFRVGPSGMVGVTGITPDLAVYGKIIGGGLPVGAVAGPRKIMEFLAPLGPVYQAGTLSANPLAMIGGQATLELMSASAYLELEKNSQRISDLFNHWFSEYNSGQFSHYRLQRVGSLFWPVPTNKNIGKTSDIPSDLADQFLPLFSTLLEKGIYLSPNAFEVGFCSMAHDEEVAKDLEGRLWS